MENVKLNLYDIFVYSVPGVLYLFGFYFLSLNSIDSINNCLQATFIFFSSATLYVILFLILVCFILGFSFHFLGFKYFSVVVNKIWKGSFNKLAEEAERFEAKHIMVRHFSKENFNYIEKWYVYRAMAYNLSFSFFLLSLYIIFKVFSLGCFKIYLFLFCLGTFLLSLLLIRRALTFHIRSERTLNECIKKIEEFKKSNNEK